MLCSSEHDTANLAITGDRWRSFRHVLEASTHDASIVQARKCSVLRRHMSWLGIEICTAKAR